MKSVSKSTAVHCATGIFLLFACFYMYDFYKCLSGFIANGFREPLVMLPMILSFLLPVICFLFFFYDVYVRAIHPAVKVGYSIFVILYAAADVALILRESDLYVSNHTLGVYDALPSFGLHFPYDMILLLGLIILWQVVCLSAGDRRDTLLYETLDGLKQRGTVQVAAWEYAILSVLAIVAFVFTGAAIYATFSALANALYDVRYIFLLLWVMLIPMMNLALLTLRPEKMSLTKTQKITTLSVGIGLNILFALAFLIFELTYPDFLVHIGKPVFLIAFSVSLPIEPGVILGIMLVSSMALAVRLILTTRDRYEGATL